MIELVSTGFKFESVTADGPVPRLSSTSLYIYSNILPSALAAD